MAAAASAPPANGRISRAPAAGARIAQDVTAYATAADIVFRRDVNEFATNAGDENIAVDDSTDLPHRDAAFARLAGWRWRSLRSRNMSSELNVEPSPLERELNLAAKEPADITR